MGGPHRRRCCRSKNAGLRSGYPRAAGSRRAEEAGRDANGAVGYGSIHERRAARAVVPSMDQTRSVAQTRSLGLRFLNGFSTPPQATTPEKPQTQNRGLRYQVPGRRTHEHQVCRPWGCLLWTRQTARCGSVGCPEGPSPKRTAQFHRNSAPLVHVLSSGSLQIRLESLGGALTQAGGGGTRRLFRLASSWFLPTEGAPLLGEDRHTRRQHPHGTLCCFCHDGCSPSSARLRFTAALINARWAKAWGKLPKSPRGVST